MAGYNASGYNPSGYAGYGGYGPMFQNAYNPQPYQSVQQNMQQQNPQQNRTGIEVMYATESEATSFLVEPNRKILFIITDKPMSIFKATDAMGISTTKRYKMEELNETPTETAKTEIDTKEFVKQEDFKDLSKKIEIMQKEYNKKFDEIQKGVIGKILKTEEK